MRIKVYDKQANQKEFKYIHTWDFSRGWYDDGHGHQYIVTFEPVQAITTTNHHYYRFWLFGVENTDVLFLDLGFWENIRFRVLQYGLNDVTKYHPFVAMIVSIVSLIVSIVK